MKVGYVTLQYSDEELISFSFHPSIELNELNFKLPDTLLTTGPKKGVPFHGASQIADELLAGWFDKLNHVELADRTKHKLVHETTWKQNTQGMEYTIEYSLKDL